MSDADCYIIITTIRSKTEEISRFEQLTGWHLVIVGHVNSQPIESSENLTFLSFLSRGRRRASGRVPTRKHAR